MLHLLSNAECCKQKRSLGTFIDLEIPLVIVITSSGKVLKVVGFDSDLTSPEAAFYLSRPTYLALPVARFGILKITIGCHAQVSVEPTTKEMAPT